MSKKIFFYLFSVLLLFFGQAQSDTESVQILTFAQFKVSEAQTPPLEEMGWKDVTLTHKWQAEDYEKGRNGWYKLTVNLAEKPQQELALYIRRMNMNVAVYINENFLHDGGSFEEPLARNWNRPLFTRIPSVLLNSGDNTFYIRLKSYPRYAYLSPVAVGSAVILSAEYELQGLLQTDIGTALFPVTLAVAGFIFSLWIRRRQDIQYLWFALAVLTWSAYSLNMFIKDPWVSTKTWEWFAHSCVDWWVILFAIFAHRFINQPHPRLELVYYIFGVSASLTYAVIDFETMAKAVRWFHGADLIIGFVSCWLLFQQGLKIRNKHQLLLGLGLSALLLTGVHDWMFQTGILGVTGVMTLHLHHYTAPLLFLFMAWHLSGRFITALNEAELLNIELENRVEQARKKLEQSFFEMSEMQKFKAVSLERERLSREIHDGMSGNIANSIMLTDLIETQISKQTTDKPLVVTRLSQLKNQLVEGLAEVRNLMLTMENDVSTLADLSSHIKDKYEQILQPHITFNTRFDFSDGPRIIPQKLALNILRMTQEIVNNINQHANASEVNLTIFQQSNSLMINVTDDGCGFENATSPKGHYGLNNLQKRSEQIGGQIKITSKVGLGCSVEIVIPVK